MGKCDGGCDSHPGRLVYLIRSAQLPEEYREGFLLFTISEVVLWSILSSWLCSMAHSFLPQLSALLSLARAIAIEDPLRLVKVTMLHRDDSL